MSDWNFENCVHDEPVGWVPTFCNHGHCALCFKAADKDHECYWDGSEHPSLFGTGLGGLFDPPGNVFKAVIA